MYPTLYHAVFDLFGIELQVLKLVNTFGFLVMLAFFSAATSLSSELKRRGKIGRLPRYKPEVNVETSQPESLASILISVLMLAFFGYKLGGVAFGATQLDGGYDAQKYLFSGQGHWPTALVVSLGWGGYRVYRRLSAVRAPTQQVTTQQATDQQAATPAPDSPVVSPETLGPEVHTGGFTTAAAVGGLVGAKLFHWLETPSAIPDLFMHPSLGNLFSGLTIYGGLLGGAYACFRYAKKHGLPFGEICDANAPGLMLAYCVGRLGCQLSGDGDWGIPNPNDAPAFLAHLPSWLWSFDFHNNVIRAGVPMTSGGFPGYGMHLVPGVYPTPLYEAAMALVWFVVLWSIRQRLTQRWAIFCVYLMMNGFSRFMIEKIRVNAVYTFGTFEFTQAELISVVFFAVGAWGLYALHKAAPAPKASSR